MDYIEINKDLNIVENPFETEDKIIFNTIGSVLVLNGARVTFKDVCFQNYEERACLLKVQGKSTANLNNVLMFYKAGESKLGSTINVIGKSMLKASGL